MWPTSGSARSQGSSNALAGRSPRTSRPPPSHFSKREDRPVRPPNSRGSGTPQSGVAHPRWVPAQTEVPTRRGVAPRGGINRPGPRLGFGGTWSLVLFMLVPLGLAGCSGGGSPTPPPTPPPRPTQPAQAQPPAPVAAAPARPTYGYEMG